MSGQLPKYMLPARPSLSMLASFVTRGERSFSTDASMLIEGLHPPLNITGTVPQPPAGGLVLLVNHYSRPGFRAWWIAITLSASVAFEIHWVVTAAWVYDDLLRSRTITPISRWLLGRIARSYRFTSMPAMPPNPADINRRAAAVRSLLRYIDKTKCPIIGLAPEGADSTTGALQIPPAGAGRLLAQLSKRGLSWAPVGIYEADGALNLHFGPMLEPADAAIRRPDADDVIARRAMMAISACLPEKLRGSYQQI